MDYTDRYIRFDWAVKRLLRNKANFGVLEGFLTVLLNEPIRIVEILESEGNQQRENEKFNRVDIKARNSKDEIIIVEMQNTREIYYLERILFGVAKAITEHIELGELYSEVKKVYSVSMARVAVVPFGFRLRAGMKRSISCACSGDTSSSFSTPLPTEVSVR